MRSAVGTAIALLLAAVAFGGPATESPPQVRPTLKRYIGADTVVAGEVDLTRIDEVALQAWLRKVAIAAGYAGEGGVATTQQLDAGLANVRGWLADVLRFGGSRIFISTSQERLKDGAFATIIPVADGGDAKAVAQLLYSGHVGGDLGEWKTRANSGELYPGRGAVIDGGRTAVTGTGGAIEYAMTLKPVERPELNDALAAAGESTVRLAVVAPANPRDWQMIWPGGAKWMALAIDAPPKARVRVVVQCESPAAAAESQKLIAALPAAIPENRSTPTMVKLLTPIVAGDRVTLELDDPKLMDLAREFRKSLQATTAPATQSAKR